MSYRCVLIIYSLVQTSKNKNCALKKSRMMATIDISVACVAGVGGFRLLQYPCSGFIHFCRLLGMGLHFHLFGIPQLISNSNLF